jgi:hypothetical protein
MAGVACGDGVVDPAVEGEQAGSECVAGARRVVHAGYSARLDLDGRTLDKVDEC